jgi:hypothetical protein
MVFVLATNQPCTQQSCTTQPETPHTVLPWVHKRHPKKGDKFTCFDIWCAGLGPDMFNNLGDNLASYKLLLDHSFRFHDICNVEEPNNRDLDTLMKELRKSQRQQMLLLTIMTEGDEKDDSDNGDNGGNGGNGDDRDNRDKEDKEYEGMEVEE